MAVLLYLLKRKAREEFLWHMARLLETWRRLSNPPSVSDSYVWRNISRQNNVGHAAFVVMVTVQRAFCEGCLCGGSPYTVIARLEKKQYVHPGGMEQQSVLSREGRGNLELFAES